MKKNKAGCARIKADEECWERFVAASTRHKEAILIRELIQNIESLAAVQDTAQTVGGKNIAEWVEWAKEWTELHDPLSGNMVDFFEYISTPKRDNHWLV